MKNIIVVFVFIYLLCTKIIYSGLPESYGFGPKAIGLAGAVTSTVNDWTAAYHNIAGMSYPSEYKQQIKLKKHTKGIIRKIETTQQATSLDTFEIGFAYLHQVTLPTIRTINTGSEQISPTASNNIKEASKRNNYGVIQLGLNFNLGKIIKMPKDVPLKLGLALALRDDATLIALNDTSLEDYNFLKLGREAQTITVLTGLSGQVWKNRISIGVGAGIAIKGKGQFKITDINVAPNVSITPRHDFQIDIKPALIPTTGIVYNQPIKNKADEIHFGFAFRGESKLDLDPLTVEAEVDLLRVQLPLDLTILDFYTPHTLLFGASYKAYLKPMNITFTIDGEHQLWSKFKVSRSKQVYYDNLGVSIPKMTDAFIPKVGIEVEPSNTQLQIRLGYAYHQTFVNNQNSYVTNFLDNNKHVVSLGTSYYLFPQFLVVPAKIQLDLGLQYQYWSNRSTTKVPTLIQEDINGSTATVNSTPSYSYKAHLVIVSLGASLIF